MTTNTPNNIKLCYLIIVVPQCITSIAHLLTPKKRKEEQGIDKAKKKEKKGGRYGLAS